MKKFPGFSFLFRIELRINIEPIKTSIDPRAQVKQTGTIECLKDFRDSPTMNVVFL